MKKNSSKSLYTKSLNLKIPTMKEQYKLWEILIIEEINRYYMPTPNKIFEKHSLLKDNIEDLKKARKIFLEQLSDWSRQKPFYEKKIKEITLQENAQKFTWSIFLKNSDIVIGQITCQPKDNEAEDIRDIGWYIDPEYQGKGYITEAADVVLNFMFNEVEITAIKTSAAFINPASWKVMEKMGFKFVGVEKSTYFNDDEILTLKEYYGNKELFLNRTSRK